MNANVLLETVIAATVSLSLSGCFLDGDDGFQGSEGQNGAGGQNGQDATSTVMLSLIGRAPLNHDDPEGSVSVIDVVNGTPVAAATAIAFSELNGA